MSTYLFHQGTRGPRRFILSEVAGLYVSPRPRAFSKARAALQKSACSLMRLHHIALAPSDWSAYRHTEEEDGRVFPFAAFSPGLSRSDFSGLPASVGEALPSLGAHPLLPSALKHFGFAGNDPTHPAYGDLVYNFECKWAWSLCNAFMYEVALHRRAFVQPFGVLSFLGRVLTSLPDGTLHSLERGSLHIPWSYSSVLDLMHRAVAVPERNRRPWTDYTTGTRSLFLAYDSRTDSFVAHPSVPAAGPSRSKGGVGSAGVPTEEVS